EACGEGRGREPAEACAKVLLQEPHHFWASYVRTLCDFQRGEWRAAKVGLTGCLKVRPGFLWARLFLATAQSELKEADLAEQDFEAVLTGARDQALRYLALTNRRAHWMRSNKAEKWSPAERDLNKAIQIQPDSHVAYRNPVCL